MLFFRPKTKENIYRSRRKQLGAFPSSEKASYFILSFSDYHCLCILDTGNPPNHSFYLYFRVGTVCFITVINFIVIMVPKVQNYQHYSPKGSKGQSINQSINKSIN